MNDLTTKQTFEEKLKTRIKDSIGDLMTDEDLTKLVEKGIQSIFFDKRCEKTRNWAQPKVEKEPLIEEMLKDLLKPRIDAVVQKFISDNKDVVHTQIQKAVDGGISKLVLGSIDNYLAEKLLSLKFDIQNDLGNMQ